MRLETGDRLASYEIVGHLGKGGMGEVYRARDSRLRREVALKVLPIALANDSERLARFEREAQLLASINHANIAAIYGIEEADGVRALVLELVEGVTLADRIDAGALPLEEALAIAAQIADALDAAHERGVIHRDLKPANVKVRDDGSVKVLDFGLAKVFEPFAASAGAGDDSPTLTAAMTQPGTLLGTAAYMSPEQARGRPVDKRADVWAFGCLVFEMITGRRAFNGETVSDTLAELMKSEPAWESLPPATPATVRVLLRRCLEKDPRRRLRDLGDARLLMDGAFGDGAFGETTSADGGATASPATAFERQRDTRAARRRRWSIGAAVAVLVLGLGVALGVFFARGASGSKPAPRAARFVVGGASPISLRDLADTTHVAISPDGNSVVYTSGPPPALFLRELGDVAGRVLEGTHHSLCPFFSPDGKWIGYMQREELHKVSAGGGAIETVCELPSAANARGATWNDEDTIVFALDGGGLFRVPAAGGAPVALTHPAGDELHSWPHFLPGGKSLLFEVRERDATGPGEIAVLELASGESQSLNVRGSSPRYLPTGHLVYATGSTLFAVPFDVDRLRIEGEPVPVLEKVAGSERSGASEFAVAQDGSLVFVTGEVAAHSTLGVPVWVGRDGTMESIPNVPVDTYVSVRVAPDGRTLALDRGKGDIWTYDVGRATLTRLMTDAATDSQPVFTPDSRRIVYRSNRGGEVAALYWQNADGSGPAERLAAFDPPVEVALPEAFTPDGTKLLLSKLVTMQMGIATVAMQGDRKLETLIDSGAWESAPAISPDGHWIAYHQGGGDEFEVFVERFPELGERRQISVEGGHLPQWSPDGRELYFAARGQGRMFAVQVETEPRFEPGLPRLLFEGPYLPWWGLLRPYSVAPDGRFLMVREVPDEEPDALFVIYAQGWADDVARSSALR